MEEMSSLWSYPESIEELKQKLLYTTLELESVRAQANAEKIKSQEYTMQLLQLVKAVCKERDEAKDQLQKLLNKIIPSNSSVTECNSFSDTYNYDSHTSSPANSFFDAVSSPDLSNPNQTLGQDDHDEGSLVIERMTEGKCLPEKGKLLHSVLGAGPLLQTLMVAGPLPRWRNPPPHQPFEIPSFCVSKGLDTSFVPKLPDSSFVEMNYGSSHMISTISKVKFGSGAYGSCLDSTASLIAGGTDITSSSGFSGKRQRSQ